MSRSVCAKCGTGFVGIPERPIPPNTICKYCEIAALKEENARLRADLLHLRGEAGPDSCAALALKCERMKAVVEAALKLADAPFYFPRVGWSATTREEHDAIRAAVRAYRRKP